MLGGGASSGGDGGAGVGGSNVVALGSSAGVLWMGGGYEGCGGTLEGTESGDGEMAAI